MLRMDVAVEREMLYVEHFWVNGTAVETLVGSGLFCWGCSDE